MNKTQYLKDLKFGNANQKTAIKYLEEHFSKILRKKIIVEEFKNTRSVFDYIIRSEKILIELKSRRNDINKYPTQMVGQNKIRYGRTKMKSSYRIFFAFMLKDKLGINKNELYIYEDMPNIELKTKLCGNYKRNDKTDTLCLINNSQLELISIF